MNTFVLNNSVSKAEMIWALQTVMWRSSLNCCRQLLTVIIQGNKRAKKITLDRTKASWIINDGPAVYYKDLMAKYLSLPFSCAPFFVTCFDETFTMLAIPNNMICILSILMKKNSTQLEFILVLSLWVMALQLT